MAIRDLIPWSRPSQGVDRVRSEHPVLRLHDEMNRMFDDFFRGVSPWRSSFWGGDVDRFMPSVNVSETDKEMLVTAELPGLSEKDVEIELAEGGLTLSGEKKVEKEEKHEQYHTVERSYGKFQRFVPIPFDVDPDKVSAEFKNGVLKITVPKPPELEKTRKKIEVKTE